jgi:serine/threonine-protein kinase
VDLSGGESEYLADGMAETLISALSKVEGLQVAARTSAFSFKGRNEDVRQIGTALGVGAVLEGSVQRAGDRLRITAQLVNTVDGFELWSESFDRNVADVFAVQDEVARAVVAALEVELIGGSTSQVVEQGTGSIEAYQAYLRGLFFWNKRTADDMERAAESFHAAIAADSAFAAAWAGLATAYVLYLPSEYGVQSLTPAEALTRAEQAARRALELDDRLAAAHTALAEVLKNYGRLEESEASFQRAVNAGEPYPTAHQWYATMLVIQGRTAEALEQIREAARLDPLSLVILVELGEVLEADGQFDAATAAYDRVLELYPDTYLTGMFVGMYLLTRERQFDRAADLLAGYLTMRGVDAETAERVRVGIRDPSRRLATIDEVARTERPEWALAAPLVRGDVDAAVAVLERQVDGPNYEAIYMPVSLAMLAPDASHSPRVRAVVERWIARRAAAYGARP